MTPGQKKALGGCLFILLALWGIGAPVAAYYMGLSSGFSKGKALAYESWKRQMNTAVGTTRDGVRKVATGATVLVTDSMTSVQSFLTTRTAEIVDKTRRLTSTVKEETSGVLTGLGTYASAASTSAGVTLDQYGNILGGYASAASTYTAEITSYTAALGREAIEEAREARGDLAEKAAVLKDAAGRRTGNLVRGARRRVSTLLNGDSGTTEAVPPAQ